MSATAVAGNSPVTTGLSVSHSKEGLGMLPFRPTAPEELSKGYRSAGELARQRERLMREGKDERAAKMWGKLAVYCEQMSHTKAVDDDQHQFQRDQMRYYREVPMTVEEMDVVGVYLIDGNAKNPGIDEWKWAALELALGYLTEQQRACFVMIEGGVMTRLDVAELLGMDEESVRTHWRRAKETLKKRVAPLLEQIRH